MNTVFVRSTLALTVAGAAFLASAVPALTPTARATNTVEAAVVAKGPANVNPLSAGSLLFSVYPGGGTGETPNAAPVNPNTVINRIHALKSDRPFGVHLYTAWSWHDPRWLDLDLQRYQDAGLYVTLTVKYSPPAGHDGDVDGYLAFVRGLVRDYSQRFPGVARYVIGNEANQYGNPEASDGPFRRAHEAVALGALAARDELDAVGSPAQVGINMAASGADAQAEFLQGLVDIAGPRLNTAVAAVGLNTYPNVWFEDTGDPYRDMVNNVAAARYALGAAGFGREVTLDIMENGFPTADEHEQAEQLTGMVRAVIDHHAEYGVGRYSWFDLWDADSHAGNRFFHYGLLRSDLSPKPAFERYRSLIAGVDTGENRPPRAALANDQADDTEDADAWAADE